MAVLIFDESWDVDRIEWEIDRLKTEMTACERHIKKLQEALELKRKK